MALSLLVICIIVIYLLSMKIKVNISIRLSFSENKMLIQGKTFFGLLRMKREFSLKDVQSSLDNEMQSEIPHNWTEFKDIFSETKPFREPILAFLFKMKIRKLEWKTEIGLGDAAASSIAAGVVWSIKGALLAIVRSNVAFKSPTIVVTPNFQQFAAETSLKCMVLFRAGNAILTGYRLYKQWKKQSAQRSLEEYKCLNTQLKD